MFHWKNWTWKHLFVVLLVLHIIPIWIFAYFPSQDGASHVYNGLVLKEYADNANYKIRDAWKLNITIFPNWLSHILLAAFLYVFPPVIAEKVFLTIAIGLIPIAFFYFLDAIYKGEKGRFLFAWLGFPFAYNYLLYMGFYNFQLSIAFFFFSFGYWWKHKDDMQVQHLIGLYALLLLTYLSHIASYGLVVLGISAAAGCIWGGRPFVTAWRERHAAWFRTFIVNLKPLFRFCFYMVPMYFVLIAYYLQSLKLHPQGEHRGMEWIWEYFLGVKSIVYFTDWHIPVNYGLLVVLGVAVGISIGYRIHRRQWVKRTDAFLLIALLFTYMFIRAPWSYGPGGWINDRIHLYILLMLAPWLIPDMGKYFRYAMTTCLVVFSLIHCGRTAYDHGRIATEIEELVSGTHLIEPHTNFRHRSTGWHKSDALFEHYDADSKKWVAKNEIKYVTPFVHSTAFYGVYADDVGHLENYEAAYYYFPVNRDNANAPIDYFIAWYPPDTDAFRRETADYEIIHETKHLQIYRKKRAPGPMLELWDKTGNGNLVIRFDMQPDNAETAPNHHAIGPNIAYQSGKFGWDTRAPHEAYQGAKGIEPLARDAVWGKEDAAFKLHLPNGTYRVTNVFQSAENATHTVNLLANGNAVIKKLTVPLGNEAVEHTYDVEVTDGYLTQVIFTAKKRVGTGDDWARKHNYWIWNGCTVEQIQFVEEN